MKTDTEIPKPEIRARPPLPGEVPRGAKTILDLAVKHGWNVATRLARGPYLTVDGGYSRIATSVMVWCARKDAILSASWITKLDGGFQYQGARERDVLGKLSSKELRERLTRDDD